MPPAARSAVKSLKLEAQGVELLASETEVEPHQLQEYWSLSLDLVALVTEIDDFALASPDASEEDARVIALRHRLRDITAQLAEVAAE